MKKTITLPDVSKRNKFSSGFKFLGFLLLVLHISGESWATVVTSTFTNKDFAVGSGEPAWTSTGASTTAFESASPSRGVQITLTNIKTSGLSLTNTTLSANSITQIKMILSSNGTGGTVSGVTVGGNNLKYNGSTNSVAVANSNNATYTFSTLTEYTGNIIITFTSTATTKSLYIKSIEVTYTTASVSAPITQASALNFTSIGQDAMTANWTNGDGAKRVVVMNTSNSFTDPTDGTDPTANTVYGGSGEQVVYNGTGTSVAVTGLTAATTYYFRTYEYNGSGSTTKYLTTTGTNNPNSQLTNAATSPVITIAGTINAFANTVLNSNSAEQSYTLQGANLTGDVTVTPPVGFEISKTSGSGFVTSSGSLTFTSGEIASAQNVYVRFAPIATQAYSGNITHTSTGATQVDKAVSGTGVYAEPTNQPTNFTATTNSTSQITVNWTDATGEQVPAGYLVKASTGTPTAPVDGIAETAGTLVQIVVQGAETAVFTGLNASTTYNFSIWPYTNSGAAIDYKTDGTVATASATTEDIQYPNVIITEVFGGGGNSGATLKNDFIELYNTTNSPIDISGWSIQYYSAAGTTPGTDGANVHVIPSGSIIPAKSTFLVQEAVGSGGSINLYEPDVIGTLPLSGTNGKVVLYTTNTAQTVSTSDITSITANIYFKDYLPYGNATPTWGSSTSALSSTTSATRKKTSENYVYTQNVGNDFEVVTPTPQNSGKFRSKNSGVWSNTSTWEFTDNGTWVDAISIPTGVNSKAEISNGHEVNVASNGASSSLTINPTAKLTVSDGVTLTAPVTIKSTSEGTATAIGAVTGSSNVEQYLSDDSRSWWYLSSPVTGATSALFGSDKVGQYNEATTSYSSPFSTATELIAGTGYVVKRAVTTAGTYTFAGTLNNGDITLHPTRTGTTAGKRGFNLVGNPYPSYLDWDAAYADAATSNIRNAIWYRTYSGSQMTFHTYADADGVPEITTGIIPPAQAFWIRVNADGSNGTITFKNTHRSHVGATANPLKAPKANDRPRVRLQISNGVNADEALIVAKSYASNGIDSYDIEKMSNDNVDVPEIYTLLNNQDMVINSFNSFVAGQEIALGMRPGKAGDFTINATQFENIPSDIKVILKDKLTGAETELSENASYSFNADGTETNQRFSLLFRAPGSVTGIDNAGNNTLLVYAQPSEIVVNSEELKGSNITVYTATGQSVLKTVAAANREVLNGNFTPGVYFVKVNNTVKKVSVK